MVDWSTDVFGVREQRPPAQRESIRPKLPLYRNASKVRTYFSPIRTCRWCQQWTFLHIDRPHGGNDVSGSLLRAAVAALPRVASYEVIKSMTRMIATELLVF
jgi:hypothetical protein